MEPSGFDFGVKPRVMVVGDLEFPELLAKAEFTALGYLELPHFGVLANPALLVMLFEDITLGHECFSKFNSWVDEADDGDAVGVSFIEFYNGDFGMCIFPENEYLIERTIPDHLRSEVEILIVSMGYIKMFPEQSERYCWFRAKAESSPFVLALGSIDKGPELGTAFRKRKVNFFKEDEIPHQSIEALLANSQTDTMVEKIKSPMEDHEILTPYEVFVHRDKQLRRFFPVTIERFKVFPALKSLIDALTDNGYKSWQIIQAGCNLAFQYQNSEVFERSKSEVDNDDEYQNRIIMNKLDAMLQGFEDITRGIPPAKFFSKKNLRNQIHADSQVLISHFTTSAPISEDKEILQQELETLGLLDDQG